jgi:hypothetical protein
MSSQTEPYVILVAFVVDGHNEEDAHKALMQHLPKTYYSDDDSPISEYWVAEDNRYDNSDNNSAVFIPPGTSQEQIRDLLRAETWLIVGIDESESVPMYWSNLYGWVTRMADATMFSVEERFAFTLPHGAIGWMLHDGPLI